LKEGEPQGNRDDQKAGVGFARVGHTDPKIKERNCRRKAWVELIETNNE